MQISQFHGNFVKVKIFGPAEIFLISSEIDYVNFSANLANNVEILLHDHFSGSIDIANPLGLISSSLGASPLGMKK